MSCEHGRRYKSSCSICNPEYFYERYERRARERHLSFQLTFDQFTTLVQDVCFYCGAYPALGVDRKNNSYGYTPQNSVSCCSMCNLMKRTLGEQEFLRQVMAIARHQERKEQLRKEQLRRTLETVAKAA